MGQPGATTRPTDRSPTAPTARPARRRTALGLRRLVVALTGLVTLATGSIVYAGTADAANPPTPGDFTGLGFDQCLAPTSAAMGTWWNESPYAAVGIYISGDSRGCPNQPNLSAGWVTQQLTRGWKLLPITLGPQASCTTRDRYLHQVRISASSGSDYAKARGQGATEATKAVNAAAKLGITKGTTLWYDLEAFSTSNTACRDSAMAFLSSWTLQLRKLGYVAGAYSSAASGIKAMADATKYPKRFTMPDRIWIADWNGVASTHTSYIADTYWNNHRRVHQYRGGHNETYGGVTINIDNNFLDLGKGSVAAKEAARCGGVPVSFTSYTPLKAGTTDTARTKALQCLLKERDYYAGAVTGTYDAATTKAVRAFQAAKKHTVRDSWHTVDWMTLLTMGGSPTLKWGSTGEDVRRLQRALNAAGVAQLAVTGVASQPTMSAVLAYRRAVGLPAITIANSGVWAGLKAGKH